MKPVRQLLTIGTVSLATVVGVTVGSHLIDDVQFARAEAQVADARDGLKSLNDLASAFKTVNRAMEQSVVQIIVDKRVTGPIQQRIPLPDFFDREGPDMPEMPQMPDGGLREQATGSGVIMDVDNGEAYVVTNNHVVSDATKVDVVLYDGRHVTDASVVGTDPKTDVAVVKIKADHVIAAKWGDSDKLDKGDIIMAFGSPFGYVGSMSHGIVSALNRQARVIQSPYAYEDFIQVDAPINPGNSGGPLVNLNAEVVGINTAIASRTGSFAGIGFAIPSNQAKHVYESLKANGRVVRGYLGVQIQDVKVGGPDMQDMIDSLGFKGDNGVLVVKVPREGPAFKVLQAGDIITGINGKSIDSMSDLRNRIAETKPGTKITLNLWRDKKDTSVDVTLAEQPGEVQTARGPTMNQTSGIGVTVITPSADDLESAGLNSDAKGAMVTEVAANSPAFRAGIAAGDLITRIGDKQIKNADDAQAALKGVDLSKGLRIDVLNREGEKMVRVRKAD